jgi:hypothetical protein
MPTCALADVNKHPHTHLCWRPAPHTIFLCVHAGTTTARRQSPPARPRASESATSTTPSTLQTWRNDVHHSLGGSFRSCPGECRTLFQHTHDTHRKLPSRTRSLYTIPRSHASNSHDDTMQYLSSMRGCCVREASNATAPAPLLCWRTPNRHLTLSSTSHTIVQQTTHKTLARSINHAHARLSALHAHSMINVTKCNSKQAEMVDARDLPER